MSDFDPAIRNAAWWSGDSRLVANGRGFEAVAIKTGKMERKDRISLVGEAIFTAEMNTTCIQALCFLEGGEDTDLECLSKICGVSRPAITRTCDILERRKLITRRRDKKDRRCVWVKITARGEHLLTDMVTPWEDDL